MPTLPAPPGPEVSLRVLRTSSALRTANLPLRVGCDTPCTVTVTGAVAERRAARRGAKPVVVTLRRVTMALPAGRTAIVRPALSKAQVKRLRKALGKRRGLIASIQVTATSFDGEPTTVSRTFDATS
jgi:hypothetical protein